MSDRRRWRDAGRSGAALGICLLAGCATIDGGSASADVRLARGLGACGLSAGADDLTIDWSEGLVTLQRRQALSDKRLRCAARVLIDHGLDFRSAEPGLAQRYATAWEAERREFGARMSKLWLRRNHKARPPRFVPERETLSAFVRKLEALCGAPPQSVWADSTTILVPWLEDAVANERVSCVYLAALASELGRQGITVRSLAAPRRGRETG